MAVETERQKNIKLLAPQGWIAKGDYWLFRHANWWWKISHWNFTEWEKK